MERRLALQVLGALALTGLFGSMTLPAVGDAAKAGDAVGARASLELVQPARDQAQRVGDDMADRCHPLREDGAGSAPETRSGWQFEGDL